MQRPRQRTLGSAVLVSATSIGLAISLSPFAQAVVPGPDHTVTGSKAYTSVVPGYTDPVLQRCSTDNRQQNESSLAINPMRPNLVAAGANDYCTIPTAAATPGRASTARRMVDRTSSSR